MKFLRYLFTGCRHSNTTFPMTTNKEQGPVITCLDCGTSFLYDFDTFTRGDEIPQEILRTA